jgi:hypothetical protein
MHAEYLALLQYNLVVDVHYIHTVLWHFYSPIYKTAASFISNMMISLPVERL